MAKDKKLIKAFMQKAKKIDSKLKKSALKKQELDSPIKKPETELTSPRNKSKAE